MWRTAVAAGRLTCIVRRRNSIVAINDIHNYRQAAPDLATSGQPREDQLAAIAAAGYDVVINLALHDDPRYSLIDEASSVRVLGMEYVHIPVQFGAPTTRDLTQFFEAMDRSKGRRVWVHCAANMRVTAFLGLYWQLREGWPQERAFSLMRDVWQPNDVWSSFIAAQVTNASAA
jgi:protein tyrosine phosphatase (PTP) superfamily phosphohydrolase (DUF442 family)